jgi:hypothetical protein
VFPELAGLLGSIVAAIFSYIVQRRAEVHAVAPPPETEVPREEVTFYLGPFTYAWLSFLAASTAVGLALLLAGVPSGTTFRNGDYDQLFSTSAQVIAGLLVVLAVELIARGRRNLTREPRAEIVQALLFIAIGQVLALTALTPQLPATVYAVSLSVVPASVLGALVGVISLALVRSAEPAEPPNGI